MHRKSDFSYLFILRRLVQIANEKRRNPIFFSPSTSRGTERARFATIDRRYFYRTGAADLFTFGTDSVRVGLDKYRM